MSKREGYAIAQRKPLELKLGVVVGGVCWEKSRISKTESRKLGAAQ